MKEADLICVRRRTSRLPMNQSDSQYKARNLLRFSSFPISEGIGPRKRFRSNVINPTWNKSCKVGT